MASDKQIAANRRNAMRSTGPRTRSAKARSRAKPPHGIVFDMDSSESQTHGEQEMSVWNGHYACTCYHPLFVFNQFGDLERCVLRPASPI